MKHYKTIKLSKLNSLDIIKDDNIQIDKLIIDTKEINIPVNIKNIEIDTVAINDKLFLSYIPKHTNIIFDPDEPIIIINMILEIIEKLFNKKIPFGCKLITKNYKINSRYKCFKFSISDKKIFT